MTDITQVYIVTCDCYSSYGISSVYLTLEEAQAAVGDSKDDDGYGCRVEVWPVGEHKRTLGSFHHECQMHPETGEIERESIDETGWATIDDEPPRSQVLYIHGSPMHPDPYLIVRAYADTQERASKVYSEIKARVRHELSIGVPARDLASRERVGAEWRDTADSA